MSKVKSEQKSTTKKTPGSGDKKKKSVVNAVAHIFAGFNNTIVSISDNGGNVICSSSAGKHGFKGSRKSTPYAAQVATQHAINAAKEHGVQNIVVEINGPGAGREASLRAIQSCGINVALIKDVTYLPHNGCRPAKSRRV